MSSRDNGIDQVPQQQKQMTRTSLPSNDKNESSFDRYQTLVVFLPTWCHLLLIRV